MQHALVTSNPTFLAYVVTSIVLCLNLLGLWVASGAVRARGGVAINPEDGARYGVCVSELDPPSVARYLRVHRNAEATTYPFLLLGLVYVLAGGSVWIAAPIFALFVMARLAHSIVYLRGIQPWRTIAFATSLMATMTLMLAILYVFMRA
ncbi:MAPEG family protein [Methylovirgula sp. 4M-Z18]|uniref:MAPEG family protein n=1 Tax=Methylovirgula sp. 4M-Z18 TaxID=2293567 RepID=UPI000E2FD93E|nr:MAPEG family protein [Methylovirgula sp. 4M-Z18]RFB79027.1 MAPEG family protein [Methylovirgula sp. 4M-Z18]